MRAYLRILRNHYPDSARQKKSKKLQKYFFLIEDLKCKLGVIKVMKINL